jgi:hypothetical protein
MSVDQLGGRWRTRRTPSAIVARAMWRSHASSLRQYSTSSAMPSTKEMPR